jgi:hypothetical protein
MNKWAKYQKIVAWAQLRYTRGHTLIVSTGGVPSTYSRIEDAAFNKYLRLPRDADGRLIFKGAQ